VGEPGIDVPLAAEEDLLLQATAAAGIEKGLGVLEVVMPMHDGPCDLGLLDGFAIERGDDADEVWIDVFNAQQVWLEAVQARCL
jgi:hypothetical protein